MPRLLTVKEYAELMRLHPRSVYRRIWEGRQAGVCRDGRTIRIDVTVALRRYPTIRVNVCNSTQALNLPH